MASARTPLRWLLLALLPCLAPCCDRCPEPPCSGQYVGSLGLRPASAQWLPTTDSVVFVNSNGFRAVLGRVTTATTPDSVLLPATASAPQTYDINDLGSRREVCNAYFRAALLTRQYQGRNLNIYLQFNLLKNLAAAATVPYPRPLTQAADTLPDLLVLAFNHQHYAELSVPISSASLLLVVGPGTAQYRDSVQLAGRLFRGVYQVARPTSSTEVQPERFFFQAGRGLVGFIYTNGEEWALL